MAVHVEPLPDGIGQIERLTVRRESRDPYVGFTIRQTDGGPRAWIMLYAYSTRGSIGRLAGKIEGDRSVWTSRTAVPPAGSRFVSERVGERGWKRTQYVSEDGGASWSVLFTDELERVEAADPAGSPAPGERAEVEAQLQRYAAAERAVDANAIAAFYAPDGELIHPGMEILTGPVAIREFLASFEGVKIDYAAMQWGTYAQRVAVEGKPAADYHGRFVAQWVRRSDGGWALRRLLTQPAP